MVRRATACQLRGAAAALWIGALLGLGPLAPTVLAADPALRVCLDPDNLPFSAAEGAQRGVYVELAELVGRKLDLPVAYTWYYTHYQRRAMRNTILADACDAMFALPASAEYRHRGVQKSRPFLDVGYALVAPPGSAAFGSLEALKGKRIAVQFSSTPHVLLSTLEGFTTLTYKEPAEVFAALAQGEADVGFLWGPVAGYENQKLHQGKWTVTPVTGHQLSGQVVVGVRAGQDALKTRIDQALTELQPQIRELACKYGFPSAPPVSLESRVGAALPPARAVRAAQMAPVSVPTALWRVVNEAQPGAGKVPPAAVAAASAAASSPPVRKPAAAASRPASSPRAAASGPARAASAAQAATTASATPPAPPLDPVAQAGRVRFNDQCAHCHGSDGASPVRERDVRRLTLRYDAKWQEVALTTIRNGRPDQGMPTWKDTLGEKEIKELLAFLATIQK